MIFRYGKELMKKFGNVIYNYFLIGFRKIDKRYYIRGYGYGLVDLKSFCKECLNDSVLYEKAKKLKEAYGDDTDNLMIHITRYVHNRLTYKSDQSVWDLPEYWQEARVTYDKKTGDCVANYEEIYTKDGIKLVGELKVGDIILSYDLKKKEYYHKPIIKIWEKGKLPIKRVHLRNGQHIDITDNHPLWSRTNQQEESKYEKTYLKDIDLTRWWKRKIPIAKKIPYEITEGINEWLDEDLMFVVGHFLAEGWVEKNGWKVQSSGYDLIESIIPILEDKDIPFTEYKNNSGVPCINFLKSDFKEYLKTLKKDSFDIHLPEHIFHKSENKLQALLDGFWLGDGHNGNYPDKRGWKSNKQEVYSTSSEQLARDIQRIGLQIGKTFHIWKQENHQGLGNKPIYRITYNPKSHFLKDFGYKDISEVSISWIEDLEETEMRDFEVKDTHTFIFKNGLISHQCEDGAILILTLARLAGVPSNRIFLNCGMMESGFGHAYITYRSNNGIEYILDWCYHYTKDLNRIFFEDKRYIKPRWFFGNEVNFYK